MNWHARQTEINTGDTYSSTIYKMGILFQKLKDIHHINRRAGQSEKKKGPYQEHTQDGDFSSKNLQIYLI